MITVPQIKTMDGNEAAAYVAYKINEVIAIYPITPASAMGELADSWSAHKRKNLWGDIPKIVEMQSEGGAAGAVHGALQAGALTTTFTASQGLLLMLPNMYKIAGELSPAVFHIAARSVATQALSIFGDHTDVMSVRSAGWAMLFANNVQEVMDFALLAQAASLESRIPFLHVFDGFRTSHEISRIEVLTDHTIEEMIDYAKVLEHRERGMNPDRPFVRGTAQNPDTFFQSRESVNPYYLAAPEIMEQLFTKFEGLTGRSYSLFEYTGDPDAEEVIILMGSGADAVEETVEYLNSKGEKTGLIKVRLFRPFSARHLIEALPKSVKSVAVLDRSKEPGSTGEPLYHDILSAFLEDHSSDIPKFTSIPKITGGRYGLSSKEFDPGMICAIFDELKKSSPKKHFTIGIKDDLTHSSLPFDQHLDIESDDITKAVFWGLGADGTVSANKSTIKIIGEETELNVQGYFVYDSRKSGARTISHLRFGSRPVNKPYLIRNADFVGVHQFGFLRRYDTLKPAAEKGTLLINAPFKTDDVWNHIPGKVQQQILTKKLKVYVIDAYEVARKAGLGMRINTIMQTCFFAISGVLPRKEALLKIKEYIHKSYSNRGKHVVKLNIKAVNQTLEHLHEIEIPDFTEALSANGKGISKEAPEFVQQVIAEIIKGNGDDLPVSAFPSDGTYPTGTTRWEKRDIAQEIPVWDPDICIQCGKCVMVCPHAVIRSKVVEPVLLADAPDQFLTADARWKHLDGQKYTLQISAEDCTGCSLCVEACPVKNKSNVSLKAINMTPKPESINADRENWEYFTGLPEFREIDHEDMAFTKTKDVQLLEPYFEFSGACAGCGETPYLSLLTRLFGDRMLVANATGCSSIYGGNLPATPWSCNTDGKGPAWNNSLFEDNAEFGLGMRLAADQHTAIAHNLLWKNRGKAFPESLVDKLVSADLKDPEELKAQKKRLNELQKRMSSKADPLSRRLKGYLHALTPKSVWIIGGDGWAYDIGFGGLDHVLASGENINVLVLDTEVYSNTGGQASKATGMGAIAKFAASGKETPKKDLGRLGMTYGYIYVAQVAMGADENQLIRAFREAESYDGPSLMIAYSQCIAHGIDMTKGMNQQKLAVRSGYWPLYRFDPRRTEEGLNPLQLDSKAPDIRLKEYAYNEQRYKMLQYTDSRRANMLINKAQKQVNRQWQSLTEMADQPVPENNL